MNPDDVNPMAFDYGYGDCASTCCSSINTNTANTATGEISNVINVLDSQCESIEDLMDQLDRNCARESAVRSKLSTLLSNLTVVQHMLETHTR